MPSGVYQQYDFASLRPEDDVVLEALTGQLTAAILEAATAETVLDDFDLNEADLHRYRTGQAGLSVHHLASIAAPSRS